MVIDSPLVHLDRPFDYAVPASMDAIAQPGVRVRVRMRGQLLDGWLVSRIQHSDFTLVPLHAVVSPEPVVRPEVFDLCRAVALRWAGTLSDVLRHAVPSRHARAESAPPLPPDVVSQPGPLVLEEYPGGTALVRRTIAGEAPRAIVTTGNDDVAALLAGYAHAVGHAGGGTLIVVPDRGAVERVVRALEQRGVPSAAWTTLMADDGPEVRYRNWLRVLRGQARVVIGTRSAVFAPVVGLVAVCVWDEWDESLTDPQAPYWNARDVAVLRSRQQGTALVLAGAAVSAQAAALVPWAAHLHRPSEEVRQRGPRVRCALDQVHGAREVPARIPSIALQTLRKGLATGPVLALVARPGYQPRLACDGCRVFATCAACRGPLVRTARTSAPTCSHCGAIVGEWQCPLCQGTVLRTPVVGSERTAEELGRAFPNTAVRTSSGSAVLRTVDSRPQVVVATPGAVPQAPGGYSAAVLLDGNMMLARPDLLAAQDTFARWSEAVAAVRAEGEVVVVADSDQPAVQALIRHDPMGFAQREAEARAEVALPPSVRLISLTGSATDVEAVAAAIDLAGVTRRGPVAVGDGQVRLLLSVPPESGLDLARAVRAVIVARAAGNKGAPVTARVDPRVI